MPCGACRSAAVSEGCARYHVAYRPEAEGAIALPQHEFGLDVIALVGMLRHRERRSVPEIHAILRQRGVAIAERSVTNLLDRYDELLAVSLTEGERLRGLLASQGRVILALDGLQPDVGHEVLWVVRDCLSGEVLLARSLLSGTAADLASLLREVAEAVGVPVAGVISDGQTSIRRAVEQALPGVPHQLCQFHFLREAAHPIFEADRHAKKEAGKSRYAGSAGSSEPWRAPMRLRLRSFGATVPRCAARLPTTDARRSPPRGHAIERSWIHPKRDEARTPLTD